VKEPPFERACFQFIGETYQRTPLVPWRATVAMPTTPGYLRSAPFARIRAILFIE